MKVYQSFRWKSTDELCLMILKSDPKKSLFLKNMHFLCDAIDLKQSVEGTLKVQGKSLTTILDEVHFIVNLYNFSLPLIPQTNPSFPKVSHLPLPSRTTFAPLFLLTPLFWGYLNSQVRINKMVNSLDYHPCPSRLASRIHPFIFL